MFDAIEVSLIRMPVVRIYVTTLDEIEYIKLRRTFDEQQSISWSFPQKMALKVSKHTYSDRNMLCKYQNRLILIQHYIEIVNG